MGLSGFGQTGRVPLVYGVMMLFANPASCRRQSLARFDSEFGEHHGRTLYDLVEHDRM